MKILFVAKQKKNVDTFLETIRVLSARGHAVTLAVQEHEGMRSDRLADDLASPHFTLVRAPATRMDDWAHTAPLLRSLRDCMHYLQPELHRAAKLQRRIVHKLREDLRIAGADEAIVEGLLDIPAPQVERLDTILGLAEAELPTDPLHDAFLAEHAPDLLLLSPLVHFGSAQADLVASARARGVPVGMLLFSWDNLSTKGCLHQPPDWMFVWNEQQRREAAVLHDFPEERVVVVGAPRFDTFFTLTRRMSREEFHEPLGLDPAQPTLLYVCSSAFVSDGELSFVRKWLARLRTGGGTAGANVIVRPHPDIALLPDDAAVDELRWPALRGLKGYVSRPFDDARALVLRTSDAVGQGLYECIAHSSAVVGLNTSAEIEAAIVGRPVYTVMAGAEAEGQSGTRHFHYLLEEHGGCVRIAPTLEAHVAQLDRELASPSDPARLRTFVEGFLRPLGFDQPVAPALAAAIERTFAGVGAAPAPSPATAASAPAPDIAIVSRSAGRTVVPLSFSRYRYSIEVYAAAGEGTDTAAPRLDKRTVQWLRQRVDIGNVVYDLTAGAGVYTVLAAKHRGAVVVAFEPGYATFRELCDNLLLNGCDGSVIPLSVGLADFDGLGELKYPAGEPGRERYVVRPVSWRVRRAAGDARPFEQPVLATTLDAVVERYGLPAPHHLRLADASAAATILAGARRTLEHDSLRTMLLTIGADDSRAVVSAITGANWTLREEAPLSRHRVQLLFERN